jgi:hypothetical protein
MGLPGQKHLEHRQGRPPTPPVEGEGARPSRDTGAPDPSVAIYYIERRAIELRRSRWKTQDAGAARDSARAGLSEYERPVDRTRAAGPGKGLVERLRDAVSTAPATRQACPTPPHDAPEGNLVGLSLSGGGIRSASFNLGILQGLASRDALWAFDYLSTVSGGGFIGSWWSAWLSREKRDPGDVFPQPEELEPQRRRETARLLDKRGRSRAVPALPDGSLIARREDPIHFVRLFSNYLTPKKGALSPDTWRLVAFFVRNLLFTWMALLPLLLAAVMAGQALYLFNDEAARSLLCVDGATTGFCAGYATDPDGPLHQRLVFLSGPALLVLAAYTTLALLWLAHSSARVALAVIGFGALGFTIFILTAPLRSGDSTGFSWLLAAVVGGTLSLHWIHSYRQRSRGTASPGAGAVRATAADHRGWLTKQQAMLLKTATMLGVLLVVAGFGYDIVVGVFAAGEGAVNAQLKEAGGWGALLLTVASAAYTAFKAAPGTDATAPKPPGRLGRIVMALAPFLVVLALILTFAYVSRQILAWTMEGETSKVLLLATPLVVMAWLEVVFAIFETWNDPIVPLEPQEGWRRFVPDSILHAIGKNRRPAGAGDGRWTSLFSPRGWARLGAIAGVLAFLLVSDWPSPRELWAAVAGSWPSLAAAGVPIAALVISIVPRASKLALGSARPAGLLVVASLTAALALLTTTPALVPDAGGSAPLAAAAWILLFVGGVVGLGWLADPNLLSIHAFYKARLTRAYLGASNTAREYDDITDAAPGDDLPLTALWNHDAGAPYHLVNTTLSLVGGSDLATSQRSAENFIMSRYHCGSARGGYRCTAEYMGGELSLGTAAAISGAAASPTMGSMTPSAAQTLLLSLLNVRLGFWAPTPSGRRWNEPHARLWPFYLLRESLANTGTLGTYCYLTDGGHFDNTGLYALVERGCRFIVVCDCGADPGLGFQDIGVAIRRCRIDFGAEINLGIDDFVARDEASNTGRTHVVSGTIRYQPEHMEMLGFGPAAVDGRIIWIKPSVTALNAADVRQYQRANSDFPQQSTGDQWYDESQFESYRRLGYESAREVFADATGTAEAHATFATIDKWFEALAATQPRGAAPVAPAAPVQPA